MNIQLSSIFSLDTSPTDKEIITESWKIELSDLEWCSNLQNCDITHVDSL